MITHLEVNETNNMIEHENLDVRTITLGISLLDCCDSDLEKLNEKIYNKITTLAKDLVPTGKQIERDFGIPIVNKRISVSPWKTCPTRNSCTVRPPTNGRSPTARASTIRAATPPPDERTSGSVGSRRRVPYSTRRMVAGW